jgi:hypothetical protein
VVVGVGAGQPVAKRPLVAAVVADMGDAIQGIARFDGPVEIVVSIVGRVPFGGYQ